MHSSRAFRPWLALVLVAGACQSSSSKIDSLYVDLENEVRHADPIHLPTEHADEIHRQRADAVRAQLDKGDVTSADALFKASVILVDTSRIDDLELAEKLARKSAELGEPR